VKVDAVESLPGGRDRLPVPESRPLEWKSCGRQDRGQHRNDRSRDRPSVASLYEVPVGKWFVEGLYDGSLGFGGEESAGACFLRIDGTV
jgi:hypothetical protein